MSEGQIDTTKFDAVAERYSERDYADPEAYYARRAKVDPELQRRYQESLASQRKDLGVA